MKQQQRQIISFLTRENGQGSGIRVIGKAYVIVAIVRRQQQKMEGLEDEESIFKMLGLWMCNYGIGK